MNLSNEKSLRFAGDWHIRTAHQIITHHLPDLPGINGKRTTRTADRHFRYATLSLHPNGRRSDSLNLAVATGIILMNSQSTPARKSFI